MGGGDQRADVVLALPSRRAPSLQLSYARSVDGAPVSALSALPLPGATVQELLAGDLTGDGFDEVVLITTGAAGLTGALVVRTNVPPTAGSPTPPADAACR